MPPVPRSIAATADDLGFGSVELACRQTWMPTLWISLSFFGGLGALFAWSTTLTPKPVGIAVLGTVSLICLLTAAYGVSDSTRMARRRFYLCEGGLLIADHAGRIGRAIAWKDVATVRRYRIATYSEAGQELHHRCRLRLTDGTKINLERPPLSDGAELCAAVESRVAEALLPGVLDALAHGEPVSFGAITATTDAVLLGPVTTTGAEAPADLGRPHAPRATSDSAGSRIAPTRRVLRWDETGGVRVHRVRVRFLRRDGATAFSARVRDIDNLAALLAVAAQHRIRISA